MKVLIDRNIQRRAITHETILKPQKIIWGDREIESPGVVERARIYPRPDEKFILEQLPYVATIGELARSKRILLCSSDELELERFTQPGPKDGWCGFNLLFDVNLEAIESPVGRTIVIRGAPYKSVGLTKKEKIEFLKSVSSPRFVELKKIFGDAHIDDAFHLWCAEFAKLDAFTTLDQRFARHCEKNQMKIASSVHVLTPMQLCEKLGEPPTDIDELASKHPWWQ